MVALVIFRIIFLWHTRDETVRPWPIMERVTVSEGRSHPVHRFSGQPVCLQRCQCLWKCARGRGLLVARRFSANRQLRLPRRRRPTREFPAVCEPCGLARPYALATSFFAALGTGVFFAISRHFCGPGVQDVICSGSAAALTTISLEARKTCWTSPCGGPFVLGETPVNSRGRILLLHNNISDVK